MTGKKRSTSPRTKASTSAGKTLWQKLWPMAVKLGFGVLVILALYVIYLDRKVTEVFEGDKWSLPAQVYGKPYLISPDKTLSLDVLEKRLQRLGYQAVTVVKGPGQYRKDSERLEVYRRQFHYFDGSYPALQLLVHVEDGKVDRLETAARKPLKQARLEPELIARLDTGNGENREFWPLKNMPELLQKTLLLVEDRNFYEHFGVNPFAILRAFYTNLKAGRTVQGGSTLTQQLAKNMYLSREQSLIRKVNEALMAIILDARYSKEQLLEAYLNEVFMGQDGDAAIHGFPLAAQFYFGQPVDELSPAQIATLVGVIKGPSYYDPRRHGAQAQERRDLVLHMMQEHDLIDTQQLRQGLTAPLKLTNRATSRTRMPAYLEQVRREIKQMFDNDSLNKGLRIYTYLDPHLQTAMESAVQDGVPYVERRFKQQQLEAAMLSVEIATGGISAMVGGKNPDFAGLNRSLDMKRNIGSLVKPAVYATALSQPTRFNLFSPLDNSGVSVKIAGEKSWQPKNYDNSTSAPVSLSYALAHSLNLPVVHLGIQLGLDNVANTMNLLGMTPPSPMYPSSLLGAIELAPYQVAQSYLTLAKNGVYEPLTSLVAVTDLDNRLLWQHKSQAKRLLDDKAIYLTNFGLQQVANKGTAKRLKQHFPYANIAAKTGTTDDLRDSWFAAFDQQFVSIAWVGKDNYQPAGMTGGLGAMELYIRTFKQVEIESRSDERPAGVELRYFDEVSGQISRPGCPHLVMAPMIVSHDRDATATRCPN